MSKQKKVKANNISPNPLSSNKKIASIQKDLKISVEALQLLPDSKRVRGLIGLASAISGLLSHVSDTNAKMK
jgi:hypothetical protein